MELRRSLDLYFEVTERGSNMRTELLAGFSTFLALSYIFVVNPAILGQAGIPRSAVLFATITTSALATLLMGIWARLPFALAPGMEINAYVAFAVIGGMGLTWPQALGAVFWSGVIFVILSLLQVRQRIIDAIPEHMKRSLALAVGVFLLLVALRVAGLIRYEGVRFAGFGTLWSPIASAFAVSVVSVFLLDRLRVRAAVLLSILVTTAYCHWLGIGIDAANSGRFDAHVFAAVGRADISVILTPASFSAILVLFLIDFYGSVAKLIGLTASTSVIKNGVLPRMRQALLIDGASTTVGALLGTSSLTVYVESGVGIGVGGRTGLTAVVCGALIVACLAVAPFLYMVPVLAASGALVWVATKLMPSWESLRAYARADMFAAVAMQLVTLWTFALDRALLAGITIHLVASLLTRRPVNRFLFLSFCLLLLGVVVS